MYSHVLKNAQAGALLMVRDFHHLIHTLQRYGEIPTSNG